ncbi:uncharacterized protein SPPG_08768 [Spizellomyces punctatus DAOM BR117]|uniref:G-protein coupled receptors family 1 profile domain-containing protein n=1 Tax=Spizellomyces punctatus (strain DAOM BR117) TaxID=645134 RepID=A0A0L0H4C6_SPIPD|nr:uncharacterized protein SPPG_08768 [Spizellomyces punctatus DAOM BR117]KNC95829.1 hypothetical protein SPPG_08768 [Spizellomyces punctatus DAOM BR117]|eukprot:XP_016603869.1 hypothetical protein SPPG_08768 [Spizellomyces punctatus DAOM BR117]
MAQSQYPGIPPPDADGLYTLDDIPMGMSHGAFYLPYRLTQTQQVWNTVGFSLTLTSCTINLVFLWVMRKVPMAPAKAIVLSICLTDLIADGDTWFRHFTALVWGYHIGGYYTCQIQGFTNGVWGCCAQSVMFAFTLERYATIVWRKTVTMRHIKIVIALILVLSLSCATLPFVFGRAAGVNPGATWCNPPWSTGTWHGAVWASQGVFFVGIVLVGTLWMYWRIYSTFVNSSKEVHGLIPTALAGGSTFAQTNMAAVSFLEKGDTPSMMVPPLPNADEEGHKQPSSPEVPEHPPTDHHTRSISALPPIPRPAGNGSDPNLIKSSNANQLPSVTSQQSLMSFPSRLSNVKLSSSHLSLAGTVKTRLFQKPGERQSRSHKDRLAHQSNVIAYALAKQAFIIISTYYVLMTPIFLVILYNLVTWRPVPVWADYLSYVTAISYTLCNPILFMTLNKQYRQAAIGEWKTWQRRFQSIWRST